jgi:hypothetical protein
MVLVVFLDKKYVLAPLRKKSADAHEFFEFVINEYDYNSKKSENS